MSIMLLEIMLLLLSFKNGLSIGTDALAVNQSLSLTQTMVSQGSIFELGFFRPGSSSKIYLGIWYQELFDKSVVWVANRDKPSNDPVSTKLEFSADGNLVILANHTAPIWSTDLTPKLVNKSTEAVLLDSGNFVIRDGSNPSTVYWQSFDYPTDTLLPDAKLGLDKRTGLRKQLVSWRNSEDPAHGLYSFGIDPNGSSQFVLEWNNSYTYWKSGIWNGKFYSSVPEIIDTDIYKVKVTFVENENESYSFYSLYNTSLPTKMVVDISGRYQQQTYFGSLQWYRFWSAPKNQSDVYAFCGAFGLYNENQSCECLQGFTPYASNDWPSGGCVRKSSLACQDKDGNNSKKDGFLERSNLSFPSNPRAYQAETVASCKLKCLQNCSCTAYAYNNSGCFLWEEDLLNLRQIVPDNGNSGGDIYIRLADSEFQNPKSQKTKKWMIAMVVVPITLLIICLWICYRRKGKLRHKGNDKISQDLFSFDFYPARDSIENEICNQKNGGRSDIELPSFSYESVAATTGNFADANKLGEGGYGPVYKGKLQNGHEVAVKRLSKRSGQGLEEFRNETILIAKLQHRNLVRLLGCCIEQDENILIYEYMPNKSLDFFLFDPRKKEMLDLGLRIRIIEGVAQGLLYLHQYSRLRIVHRDLKPSNILLDSEMNPKISDFGMAKIFGGNETQANTNRIVGTYGYMSPEYAANGLISTKSDVFSFGVLLLEIISGKRNTSFFNTDSLNLLGYAWELWNSKQSMELIDPFLRHHPSSYLLLSYINVGLLCVQENPNDRPAMDAVVIMITNEQATLPTPRRPAFTLCWPVTDTSQSEISAGNPSVNRVTISTLEAR